MAPKSEVAVDLVTRLKDKGFKDLQKETKRTEKQLEKFGKRLRNVFGAAFVANVLRKSLVAYSENEKALKRLGLQLDNLNLGFAKKFANDFVSNLSLATGIADDELYPALQRLVRATYTLTDAQKLLTLAVDISKATGKDVEGVSIALEKAYSGQNTALAKLNIGYTTASLKGQKFGDIVTDLQKRYGGTAIATQDDFATSIDRLKVAFDETKEAIGEGFIKGLEKSGLSVSQFSTKLIKLGESVGTLLGRIASFADKLTFLIDKFTLFKNKADDFIAAQKASEASIRSTILSDFERLATQTALAKQEAINAKIRAAELARLAAEEKKRAAEKKRTAEIERLKSAIQFRFDIDAINLQAALRRNISASDRERVLQLSALKISDYQNDEEAIKTLQAATQGRYDDAMNLEKMYQLLTVAGFANSKAAIDALAASKPQIKFTDNLDEVINKLKALIEGKYSISIGATITVPPIPAPGNSATGIGPGSTFNPGGVRKGDESSGGALVPPPVVVKPPGVLLPGEIGGEPFGVQPKPLVPDTGNFRYFDEMASSYLRLVNDLTSVPANFDPARFRMSENTGSSYLALLNDATSVPSNFDPARFRMGENGVTVNVTVQGSLLSQQDLVAAVTDAVYQTQRTGNSITLAV
jgi:hypothetical protein